MKKLCTFIIGMFLFQFSFAQVDFDFSDDSGNPGDFVNIDVRVSDFINIAAMQFSVNWDPNVMSYETIENISTTLPQFNISFFGTPDQPSIDDGELAVTWNLTSTDGFTIDEQNHLLFTLKCKIVGNAGSNTDVILSNTPRVIEFIDGDDNVVSTTSDVGSVSVNGASADLEFFVGSENVMVSEGFCIPITANNFANVSQAQIPVQYDENIISYTGVQNQFFSGGVTVPNNGTGTFRYIVADPTLENPLTMPNGETLFEICFTAVGASGTSSSVTLDNITDVPPPFPKEIIDNDGNEVECSVSNGTVLIQGGSSDITFYFDDIEVELGSEACIPVKTRNFDNIQTFQYAMDYNPSDLDFVGTQNLNSDLPIDAGAFNEGSSGNIRISWFDNSGFGIDIDDDVTLFEVCFDVTGDCDMETMLAFTGNINGGIEITDSQNNVLPFVVDAGTVTIVCSCAISLISSDSNDVSCNGEEDGQITVFADGGNGSYTYSWSNGDMGPVCTDGAGTYIVTVSDGANCNTSATFTIVEPSAISISGTVANEVTDCDGTIDITPSGGNGNFTYAWSDAGSPVTQDRLGLCKGTYTVTVTDFKNCTKTAQFVVNPKALQIVNFTITNVSCNGGSDGMISLDVEGGCPDYTYVWSSGDGSNLSAGNYTVTITDTSTPPNSVMGTYPITEPDAIVISNPVITGSDENNMNGSVLVDVIGGTGTLNYLWTPSGQITQDLINVSAGKYTLQVTDDNGCVVSSEEYCVGSSTVVVNFTDSNQLYNGFGVSCFGDCNGQLDGSVVVSNGAVTYTIDGTDYTSLPITDLCAGDYTVTYVDEESLTGSFEFSIISPDAIVGDLLIVSDCSDGTDGEAEVTVSGGTGIYTYQWNGTTEVTANVSALDFGAVNVVVSDENNCQFMLSSELEQCTITPDSGCFKGRSVITPNSDGANDEFVISCLENQDNTLFVYDRFGRKVYQQSNYDNTWVGLDSQGTELAENGYMWVLELIKDDGTRTLYKGTVTIVRNSF